MPAISGTVRDSSGAPVARTLRFYRRDTGQLLGSADSSGSDAPGDPHYGSVSLLLHCDGTDGSSTILDSSPVPKIPNVGAGARISELQARFGGASLRLSGSSVRLSYENTADLRLHNADFTIEGFIWLDSTNADIQIILGHASSGNQGQFFYVTPNGTGLGFTYTMDGWSYSSVTKSGAFPFAANTWYHVAASRQGTTLRLFVDGTQVGATHTVASEWWASSDRIYVGQINVGGYEYPFFGYIDELRVTRGVARYTGNFAAPTSPFPVTAGNPVPSPFGDYYFSTSYQGEIQAVCLHDDDSSGVLDNDLILRTIAG